MYGWMALQTWRHVKQNGSSRMPIRHAVRMSKRLGITPFVARNMNARKTHTVTFRTPPQRAYDLNLPSPHAALRSAKHPSGSGGGGGSACRGATR